MQRRLPVKRILTLLLSCILLLGCFTGCSSEKAPYVPTGDGLTWDEDYTESSAWQATFAVPHDLKGLAQCMGGDDQLLRQLDALFA